MLRIRVTNGIFVLLLTLLYLVAPVLCLFVCLVTYKRTVSQCFMIACAFYFGYQVGPILDLLTHSWNYHNIEGLSLSEVFEDGTILYYGKEPYHILFKYFLYQFDASDRVFAGTACAVYTAMFLIFIRQMWPMINRRMTAVQAIALFLVVVSVDYYWYLGLRFWTGTFFMMIFYTRYLMTGKWGYLLFLPLSYIFHYVLLPLSFILMVTPLLQRQRALLLLGVGISYVYKFIDYGFIEKVSQISYVDEATGGHLQQDAALREMKQQNFYFREQGNFIYQHRTDLIFFSCVFVLLAMMFKNRHLTKLHGSLFAAVCLVLIVANFGYGEYVFYTRIYKMVGLLISLYLFFLVSDKRNAFANHSLIVKVVLLFAASFSLLISLVQLRASLLNPELWFGNFWVESPIVDYRIFRPSAN